MRNELCSALVALSAHPNMVFLTGDLGFMALEPLQQAMGERFINAGVAEQNMVSVAAALAADRWDVWCYSIASFCFARPFEQIRNDVCLHGLPVKLIGNGGGYGYGVMGPTHHAVDDYGVLLTLPYLRVFIPAFGSDVVGALECARTSGTPAYIRLGRDEAPAGYQASDFAPWRKLCDGSGAVVVVTGPIAGSVLKLCHSMPLAERPTVWLVSELPLEHRQLPNELVAQLRDGKGMLVVEEHVAHGGVGQMLLMACAQAGCMPVRVQILTAYGLHVGVYGSQQYLRGASGLDHESIVHALSKLQ